VPDWKSGPFQALEIDMAGGGSGIQPLVATGVPGHADLLAIEWLPHNTARLLLDHWSHAIYSSPTFSWDPQRMHRLKLTLPSFGALDGPSDSPNTGKLSIEVDGRALWEDNVLFYGARSSTFSFGKNTVGSSIALPALECRLGDIRQVFGGK
jgi:hypothetical protein